MATGAASGRLYQEPWQRGAIHRIAPAQVIVIHRQHDRLLDGGKGFCAYRDRPADGTPGIHHCPCRHPPHPGCQDLCRSHGTSRGDGNRYLRAEPYCLHDLQFGHHRHPQGHRGEPCRTMQPGTMPATRLRRRPFIALPVFPVRQFRRLHFRHPCHPDIRGRTGDRTCRPGRTGLQPLQGDSAAKSDPHRHPTLTVKDAPARRLPGLSADHRHRRRTR